MPGFEQLKLIVALDVTYKTKGNMSINTGRGDGIRDNLVIRDAGFGSNPVISGSSVKGVVRSTIESILTQAYVSTNNEALKVCVPDTCRGTRYKLNSNGEIEKDDQGRPKTEQFVPDNRLDYKICEKNAITPNKNPCLVCQMFGSTKRKGKVTFHDAKAIGTVTTMSRTHVAIARDSGIAGGGALMTIETVPAGSTFSGSVVLVNPDDWMVGAVIDVISLLPNLGVGAKTTNGYGELEVSVVPRFVLRSNNDGTPINEYVDRCLNAWRNIANVKYE